MPDKRGFHIADADRELKYLIELQDSKKTQKHYDLNKDMFIIDCTYKSPKDPNGNPIIVGESFNLKKRVRKLLQKPEKDQDS